VQGTEKNPLAFGYNETTRSDARIFKADEGELISRMAASNDFYLSTCTTLLERMINTVPKDVVLSQPIDPIPIKPSNLYAQVNAANHTLVISGAIRVSLFFLLILENHEVTCLSRYLRTDLVTSRAVCWFIYNQDPARSVSATDLVLLSTQRRIETLSHEILINP